MNSQTILIAINAFIFFLLGLVALVSPTSIMNMAGMVQHTDTSQMEFMANFGGIFFGLGVFLFYCLKHNLKLGLLCLLIVMGGKVVARVIGFATYEDSSEVLYAYFFAELLTLVLAGLLLLKPENNKKAQTS